MPVSLLAMSNSNEHCSSATLGQCSTWLGGGLETPVADGKGSDFWCRLEVRGQGEIQPTRRYLSLTSQWIFFHFPFYPLSSCQTILASHFRTDWLSRLGLGKQVSSSTDHLQLLPTQQTKRWKYDEGRADRVIAN